METSEQMLTSAEVSARYAIPPGTLSYWARTGTGPAFYRLGRHRRYLPADINEWLQEHRVNRGTLEGVETR